jgi:hypothetical protein
MLGVPESVLRAVAKVPCHASEVLLGSVGLGTDLKPIDEDAKKRYLTSLQQMVKPPQEEKLPW